MRSVESILAFSVVLALACLHDSVRGQGSDAVVSYNRDIRPLLSDRCFACHGPDDAKREASLRLDISHSDLGPFHARDGQQALKPGDPDSSELWKRLTTDDSSLQMPPPESGKKPFTAAQKELIQRWIKQGATYEQFWSFEPPKAHAMPKVQNGLWIANQIDGFVLGQLEKNGIQPQPRADKRTLIRRVTLDLIGLPPTLQEIHDFEQDDAPNAYQKLVDRLLATPQYGEHMARYWLDLVRFADTNGMHHDHYRELSQYRDWVIRAFNANMPFDQFATEQLAGDLLENATVDQQIASGYNRLHMVMDKGTNPPQESYTRNVVDQVSAFGTVFMGMTLECAVCHDHKYDPVKQRDFYQLFAFFNNIDGDPETPGRDQQPPILKLPSPEQSNNLKELEAKLSAVKLEIDDLKKSIKDAPANDKAGGASADAAAEPSKVLADQLKEKEEALNGLKTAKDELERNIVIALVMKERTEIRPAFILRRGAYDQPDEEVSRNTPAFLPPLKSSGKLKTRLDLANWVVDKQNPLTARVTVNRFWQQFFGVGIVKTSENFGSQGEYPIHPALLDDLAREFVDSNWDVKSLVKSLVMSQTYQQSSAVSQAEYLADADNRMLARGSRIRLDSEVIRDQVLAISGQLNNSMYGKSVKPPQPTDLWKTVSMVSSSTYSFKADSGDKVFRRSFYTFWKRAMPPPQMTIFDAPTRENCTSRREKTNSPVQALLMMNENQYFEAARYLAQQLLETKEQSDVDRLRTAFETITSHLPNDDERANLQKGLDGFRSIYREDVDSARAMTSDLTIANDAQRIDLAAFTMVVNALLNLDAAKTRE